MRILVDFRLAKDLEALLIGNNVCYRPDLEIKGNRFRASALQLHVPDVLITRALPQVEVIEQWRHATPYQSLAVILIAPSSESPASYPEILAGVALYCVQGDQPYAEVEAFILAEQINNKALHRDTVPPALGRVNREVRAGSQHVALVGCGIVNLITAYYLLDNGYRVSLYDRAADPRIARDRSTLGCTHGGDDARMFSLTETRHHFNQGHVIQDGLHETFYRGLDERGWLCCDHSSLGNNDYTWRSQFENVPTWLMALFNDEIISFNRESQPLWEALQCNVPELFSDVVFTDRVLRVYSTEQQLEKAIHNERRIGSLIEIIDRAALGIICPSLNAALGAGEIAGALEVVGFTVNIHKFTRKLLILLENLGAQFRWNSPIEYFERNADAICGMVTAEGRVVADHYVLSPGAYGNELLRGLQSENKIASVVGMWLRLPNLDPRLDVSLKISRRGYAADGAAEGANVIAGTDEYGRSVIHVSSGHGYVGENPNNISPAHLHDLYRTVDETAKRYFPNHYKEAQARGMLQGGAKRCVRPWTPSGLGLFEIVKTESAGVMVVTGGHNTGGFAQSPSVAQAVLSALRGESHAMHRVYHPNRLISFLDHGGPTGAIAPPRHNVISGVRNPGHAAVDAFSEE